jgi:hypothetical protein
MCSKHGLMIPDANDDGELGILRGPRSWEKGSCETSGEVVGLKRPALILAAEVPSLGIRLGGE